MLVDALNIVRARSRVSQGRSYMDLVFLDRPICINQSDDAEKSRQVRMMHDIYDCAKETLIILAKRMKILSQLLLSVELLPHSKANV
jgi:formyltetrahydrofolate hydrolase